MTVLTTPRLRLEPFNDQHIDGLHAMHRLPDVMRYVGGVLATREQTANVIHRSQQCWAAWGTGWWAFIDGATGSLVGAGCIQHLRREAELPDDLNLLRCHPHEIGWRLHPDFWHRGLASEAAHAMAAFAFERLAAPEIVAVIHTDNTASARVAHRLGMQYRGLETWYGAKLATHVLPQAHWRSGRPSSASR